MDLVSHLKKNPFVLAPMAGITDSPFRTFMREMGAGIVVTELVSAFGIEYESQRTIDLMHFNEAQRPIGIQLFGEEPAVVARAAKYAEKTEADFVDLNFGCPVSKVVQKGAGAAMLRDPVALFKMLAMVKSSIRIPLTIKIRTGWDKDSINASEIVKVAADAGVTWVAIHGRTRAQAYEGFADWDLIQDVKSRAKIPIIGNGDIHTASQAVRRLRESGCDGVMIGRGCLKNPWIFRQAQQIFVQQNLSAPVEQAFRTPHNPLASLQPAHGFSSGHSLTNDSFFLALGRLKELIEERVDDRRSLLALKKFSSWFSAGYPNSQNFRKSLFTAQSSKEILLRSQEYFSQFDLSQQTDTSGEAFLMGGHG